MASSFDIRRLPSVTRFIDRAIADVIGGQSTGGGQRSVLVLLPDGIEPLDIGDTLRHELDRRQVRTDLLAVTDYAHLPPLVGLGAHFRLPEAPASCDELAAALGEHMPEVLFLEALERLGETERLAWARLIEQWTHTAHRRANGGEPFIALCVVAPARSLGRLAAQRAQLFLDVHYWWGLPTPAEMQILWRDTARRLSDVHLAHWRNHILPAIAAGDGALLDLLMACEGRTAEIIGCLEQFARQRGWSAQVLLEAGGGGFSGFRRGPPDRLLQPTAADERLWALGALIWTPEHEVELHPAALLLLDRRGELEHRLWRAQASLLLPLIDRVRRHVCQELTAHYGPEWPWRYAEPVEEAERELVRQSPMMCGLGHLAWLLHPQGQLSTQSHWHNLVAQARDLRNRLAHYQLVTLEEYLGLMQHVERSLRREAVP